MITEEEYEDIQVGDYIEVVDQWNADSAEASDGKMDYLLGRTLEVAEKATETTVDKCYDILRTKSIAGAITNYWYLNRFCIAKVIKCTGKSIADESLEKMLGVGV